MDFIAIITGFIFGSIICGGFSWWRLKHSPKQSTLNTIEKALELEQQKCKNKEVQLSALQQAVQQHLAEKEQWIEKAASLKATNEHMQERLAEERNQLSQLRQQMDKDFRVIAQKIMDENASKLSSQHREVLGDLLTPLKEKIKSFEEKVTLSNKEHFQRHISLTEQIKHLQAMNHQLSEEAQQLTKALKADNKQQGNWGEVVLERILERSGLQEGSEYKTQVTGYHEQGQRIQPDVVIYLPEGKHIIVDAKVSLIEYQRYITADDAKEQALHQQRHIQSIKQHIQSLSHKNYNRSADFNAPDFVLLFLPIEPSLGLAMAGDNTLFNYAWDRNVVLVTPATLLATLRTIASIWKQERQNENAREIARQSGLLYDKLVGYVAEMEKIKKSLDQAQEAYDAATKKLTTGRGNVMRKAALIRELGADTHKKMPPGFEGQSDATSLHS